MCRGFVCWAALAGIRCEFLAADGKSVAVGFSLSGTANIGGTLGVESPDIAFEGQDVPGQLSENSADAVEGFVKGEVIVLEMVGDELVERREQLDLRFLENDKDFLGLGRKVPVPMQ